MSTVLRRSSGNRNGLVKTEVLSLVSFGLRSTVGRACPLVGMASIESFSANSVRHAATVSGRCVGKKRSA
jgi:hypothetical protein